MKKIVITIIAAFFFFSAFGQHGYKQSLYTVATVTFPDTPKTEDSKTNILYSENIDGIYYIAQAFQITKSLPDEFNADADDKEYSTFINSTLKSFGGKLIYKNKITVNGLNGVEYAYSAISDSAKHYRYRRLFYFNNKLILTGVSSMDSLKKHDKIIDDFFNTFKLTLKRNEIRQAAPINLGKSFAYAFAVLLAIALIIAMIAGIASIIKKRFDNKSIP